MRIGIMLAVLAGLAITIALIAYQGFASVGNAVWSVGWGVFAVVAFHLVPITVAAGAWRALLGDDWQGRVFFLAVLRWIREAVNALLPVAQVGGDVVGARLLILDGTRTNLAGASVVVDKTLEVFSQFFFAVAGVVLLLGRGQHDRIQAVIIGLAIMLPALVGFLLAQRWGMLKLVERLLLRLVDLSGGDGSEIVGIHDAAWSIYRQGRRIAPAMFLHTLAWTIGAVEVWLILAFMGHPVSLVDAFILESLGQAVRSAAFAMPAALGAQEAGYMMLGQLVGLTPEVGLAVSLVKRVRQVLLGVPALLLWQALEGKHLYSAWSSRREGKDF
jgi:putative membrane protein